MGGEGESSKWVFLTSLVILSLVGSCLSASGLPRPTRVIKRTYSPPNAVKTSANEFCQTLGIMRVFNPVTVAENRKLEEFRACRTSISPYLERVPNESAENIKKYGRISIMAGVKYDRSSQAMTTLNIQSNWTMGGFANFLIKHGNFRYFLVENRFQEINMSAELWNSSQNNEYHSLDMHLCYNEFSVQDATSHTYYINLYKNHYQARRNIIAERLLKKGAIVCSCEEGIYYGAIFIGVYGVTREEMLTIYHKLCFDENDYKLVHWRKPKLLRILKLLHEYHRIIPINRMVNILKYGWKLALSQKWGNGDEGWDIWFVSKYFGKPVSEFLDISATMAYAIDSNMTTDHFEIYMVVTADKVEKQGLGYDSKCARGILSTFFDPGLGGIIAPDYKKVEFWNNFEDKLVLVNYIRYLVDLAIKEGLRCSDFLGQLALVERAFYLRQWDALIMNGIMGTAGEGVTIEQTVDCVELTAHLEQLLKPELDEHHPSSEFGLWTEDNYEKLVGLGSSCRAIHSQMDLRGPKFVLNYVNNNPKGILQHINIATLTNIRGIFLPPRQ